MKFIHIADVHLGMVPDSGKPWSKDRAEEIWKTFRKVMQICNREKTDLLLVAGDLFHGQPGKKDLKEVPMQTLRGMKRWCSFRKTTCKVLHCRN